MIFVAPIVNPVVSGLSNANPDNAGSILGSFISGIVGLILVFATIWTLFQLLQGGLEWISSGGDKNGVEGAQNRITNALLGVFIVFAAWAMYLVILKFLGIGAVGGGGFQLSLPKLL